MKTGALVLTPTSALRYDVPSCTVPEYRDFLRHVWSWHEEDGSTCVAGTPWMYSILIRDAVETTLVSSILGALHQMPQFDGKFQILATEEGSDFSFADLASLHAFLRSCAALGKTNETARRVCEYIMWTLGFRWV